MKTALRGMRTSAISPAQTRQEPPDTPSYSHPYAAAPNTTARQRAPYGQRDPRRSDERTDNRRRGAGEQGQEEILHHTNIIPQLNPQKPLQAIRRASNIHHRMQHRHIANHQRPIRDGQQKERHHHRQQRHDKEDQDGRRVGINRMQKPGSQQRSPMRQRPNHQFAPRAANADRCLRQMLTCAASRLRQIPLREILKHPPDPFLKRNLWPPAQLFNGRCVQGRSAIGTVPFLLPF